MISGIYAKIQYNCREKLYFILTGKTEDKKRREKEYSTGDSLFEFDYFKKMDAKLLIKGERDIREYILSKGLRKWGNSNEQFEIGSENFLEYAEDLLKTYFGKKLEYKKFKYIDYEVPALPGYGNVLGQNVTDIRSLRKMCSVIKDKPAQITTKAGVGEGIRKVKTAGIIENCRLIKLNELKSVPLCHEGWFIWQMARYTYKDFPNIFKDTTSLLEDCV